MSDMTGKHDEEHGPAAARESGRPAAPGAGTLLARGGRPARDGGGPSAVSRQAESSSNEPKPLSLPISLSSVYRFENLEQVNEVWEHRQPGHVYRRFGHPNSLALEKLISELEGAEDAVACGSGMSAVLAALSAHLEAGDTLLTQEGLYGGTQTLLTDQLRRLGLKTEFVSSPDRSSFAAACEKAREGGAVPKAILVETIANPSLTVADLPGLATLASDLGLILMVDNTFATPLACRPLDFGPALVIHSTTKYLNGHTDVIGGAVAGPRDLVDPVRAAAIAMGVTMAPFDAWLTLRGMKTLHVRFARQEENAMRIATWLEGRPGVARVIYPGLSSHPSHALAARMLSGYGAMVSFELEGGQEAVDSVIRRLRLVTFSPSLGENETTLTYPYLTSHRSLSPEEKEAAGAGPGLVRLSVGTEDVQDILADLGQALGG